MLYKILRDMLIGYPTWLGCKLWGLKYSEQNGYLLYMFRKHKKCDDNRVDRPNINTNIEGPAIKKCRKS